MVSDHREGGNADYPITMRIRGRRCLVAGAGPVGRRKVAGLLSAGAEVVLVDPNLQSEEIPEGVAAITRRFHVDDLEGACLVFAATDRPETNREIAAAARERGVPVNIADDPGNSDFFLPASFSRDDLTVSVATGGVSPAVAAMVRDEVEKTLPVAWGILLEIAGKLRARRLTSGAKSAYNQQVFQNLVRDGILAMIAETDEAGVNRLLESEFGQGCSLEDLGVSLSKGLS